MLIEDRIKELINNWIEETQLCSSTHQKVFNNSYQQIIEFGEVAIPLLLDELKQRSTHVFYALHMISGENPVHPNDRGNINKMRYAWLEWGRKHGYID